MTTKPSPAAIRADTAEVLADKASGDSLAARKLARYSDIDDGPIGFNGHLAVEKSLKAALALRGVDFPMMAHDLDLLLTMAAEKGIELPAELTDTGWLTRWGTTYEHGEATPGSLDRKHVVEVSGPTP